MGAFNLVPGPSFNLGFKKKIVFFLRRMSKKLQQNKKPGFRNDFY